VQQGNSRIRRYGNGKSILSVIRFLPWNWYW